MARYIVVVLTLFAVLYQCDGHLDRLFDAISDTRRRVHTTVHNVASSVVGGVSGEFNFNIKPATGLFDALNPFRQQQNERPQYEQPSADNRPNQGNYYDHGQQGNRGDYDNAQGQNGNHQYTTITPDRYDGRPSNTNTPSHVRDPQQGHQDHHDDSQDVSTPSNQHHDQPSSENRPVHQNDANDQLHRPEQQNRPYHERDRDVKEPTEIPGDGKKPTTYGNTTHANEAVPTNAPSTTKSGDDSPLFVPLSPDQYKYKGDKIEVNAPKRDTDQTQAYDIDIRFRDE